MFLPSTFIKILSLYNAKKFLAHSFGTLNYMIIRITDHSLKCTYKIKNIV